jgi:hypothetical protein
MRNAHGFDPINAMANPGHTRYHVGMNSRYYISGSAHSTPVNSQDAHLDAHATKKFEAIERWENEGGKLLEPHDSHRKRVPGM